MPEWKDELWLEGRMSDAFSLILKQVFRALDVDNDGYVSSEEFRVFVEVDGYTCSDASWKNQFEETCIECGADPIDGVDHLQFERLMHELHEDRQQELQERKQEGERLMHELHEDRQQELQERKQEVGDFVSSCSDDETDDGEEQ
jgi:hypothetical protein